MAAHLPVVTKLQTSKVLMLRSAGSAALHSEPVPTAQSNSASAVLWFAAILFVVGIAVVAVLLWYRTASQKSELAALRRAAAEQPPVEAPLRRGLRVVSANVWGHFAVGGRDVSRRLDAFAAWVTEQNVDILVCQELFVLSAGKLQEMSWYLRFAQRLSCAGLVHSLDDPSHGFRPWLQNSGLAVFSRFPLVDVRHVPFPVTAEPVNSKGVCVVSVEVGGELWHVGNIHLDSRNPDSRAHQVTFAAATVAAHVAQYAAKSPLSLSTTFGTSGGTASAVAASAADKSEADGDADGDSHSAAGEHRPLLRDRAAAPKSSSARAAACTTVTPAQAAAVASSLVILAGDFNISSDAPAPASAPAGAGAGSSGSGSSGGGAKGKASVPAGPSSEYARLVQAMAAAGFACDLFPGPLGEPQPQPASAPAGGDSRLDSCSAGSATAPTSPAKRPGRRYIDHMFVSSAAASRLRRKAVQGVFTDGHAETDGGAGHSAYRGGVPVSDHRALDAVFEVQARPPVSTAVFEVQARPPPAASAAVFEVQARRL